MNELEQKEILDLLESLPKPIKEAIEDSGWDMKLSVIAKKHGLLLDQITQLENLILMIMLGVIDPKKIKGEMLELNIDSQKADQMIVEIENEIFQKIKTDLVENFERLEDIPKIKPETEREAILKEIEDPEEEIVAKDLLIPERPKTPSTQVNTSEQNQKIISQDLKSINTNIIAENLQNSKISSPTTLKIDPYRELPE
jgi:hypothetical protein